MIVWEWCKNVWYSNTLSRETYCTLVWEWCKNVWYSNKKLSDTIREWFENDVKMYGIQTMICYENSNGKFENDVKMYGIQTM